MSSIMLTGEGSSMSQHHEMKISMEWLNTCLNDLKIDKVRGKDLIDRLLQFQTITTTTEHEDDSQESDISDDANNPSSSVTLEFSRLVNIINNCWEFAPESSSSSSKAAARRSSPGPDDMPELQHLMKHLLFFLLVDDDNDQDDAVVMALTKKQLTYWWIGQGLIRLDDHNNNVDDTDVDVAAAAILDQLIAADFIHQLYRTQKYRPTISLSDSQLNNQVGILRNKGGKQTMTCPPSGEIIDKKSKAGIHTLFNRDISNLSLTRDCMRQMTGLEVLHLGSWSGDKNSHIEFNNLEFLQALKHLKKLTFISFKGVSSIISLPDEICNVGGSLRILDLQDCPNLEILPKRIGNLYNLTHLDLSQCYLLQYVPKSIIFLTKLQVLKGFVIGKGDSSSSSSSCKFKDLANHLGSTLRKLSIITRKVSFPLEEDLRGLARFEKLLKLKVIWVRTSDTTEEHNVVSQQKEETFKPQLQDNMKNRRLPSLKQSLANSFRRREENLTVGPPDQLQKLEVHDIPQKAINSLIFGDNNYKLQSLKKLYIIGGDVYDITNLGKVRCGNVDTIKLKYLTKLHMSWMQLKASFPAVAHMEIVQCPFLTFFPCDTTGIWEQLQNV